MRSLKLTNLQDCNVRLRNHRFGNYDENQPSLFGIKIPFPSTNPEWGTVVELDVAFDFIDGDLAFLLGLPTLAVMGASVNHNYMMLSFSLNNQYHRLKLVHYSDKVRLPFESEVVLLENGNPSKNN